VPPRDPRLCPALERALPADDAGYSDYHDGPGYREVLFGDGGWRFVTVKAWWRNAAGRVVVQVEWSIEGETWTEDYLADPKRMREA
jgi:hypothetical protein